MTDPLGDRHHIPLTLRNPLPPQDACGEGFVVCMEGWLLTGRGRLRSFGSGCRRRLGVLRNPCRERRRWVCPHQPVPAAEMPQMRSHPPIRVGWPLQRAAEQVFLPTEIQERRQSGSTECDSCRPVPPGPPEAVVDHNCHIHPDDIAESVPNLGAACIRIPRQKEDAFAGLIRPGRSTDQYPHWQGHIPADARRSEHRGGNAQRGRFRRG